MVQQPPAAPPPSPPPPPPPDAADSTAPVAFPARAAPLEKELGTLDGQANGLNRCPGCGSTDISHVYGSYALVCGYCRHTWTGASLEVEHGLGEGIDALKGRVIGSGAAAITDTSTLITLKCGGCGSEVVINTTVHYQNRCHWCRHTLSLNSQVPNGAVPDGILPFYISRDRAAAHIRAFVAKRQFFASDHFKRNFHPNNIMGVYLPYLVVDGNIRARLDGHGEVLRRRYTLNKTTFYDADVYRVYREFDMVVDDLIVESSSYRADIDPLVNTNNIVNSILPFDVKSAVTFDANYLGEFTSEKRNVGVDAVFDRVNDQFMTLAREKSAPLTTHFNRGIRWDSEQLAVHGTRWVSIYLPVWLYTHYERRPNGTTMLHYIAVNGRNGQTMGSVPIQKSKLLGVSFAVGSVVGVISMALLIGGVVSGMS